MFSDITARKYSEIFERNRKDDNRVYENSFHLGFGGLDESDKSIGDDFENEC